MTRTVKAICVVLGLLCVLTGLVPKNAQNTASAKTAEVKGVWVTTLYSMDYPQKPTADKQELMKSADRLVSSVKEHGYNTLFLQVRPSGDAFYKSEIYPYSRYLTGEEGKAPTDGFDPLEYIIRKAHSEGLSLHAWINPYRITASDKDSENLPETSIAKKYPHLSVRHTDGKLYLNPGEPEAIKLVVDGAVEIVKNYQVDGIHIDDYFYPSSAFPDGETYTKYGGDFTNVGDWRRDNTRRLVKELRDAIKTENRDVVFSVSPCGIWANKESHKLGSDTHGKQAYFDYFADTRGWVKEELVDMIIPQIYWENGNSLADFKTVTDWWCETVRDTNVALCIGQALYKAADAEDKSSPWYGERGVAELENQLRYINGLDEVSGYAQFRLGSISKNAELAKAVKSLNAASFEIFTDTKNYPWAKTAIETLYRRGVVNGMGDGSFGCARPVIRADFVVMLVRSTAQKVPFNENFSDVTPDKYYYNEVGIAKVLGYTEGREGNLFDPTGQISREDMATLVWRVMTKQGEMKEHTDIDLNEKFTDANEISEYAKTAVGVLVESGIMQGYETGDFKPKGIATRAECAVLLYKAMQK